MSKTNTKKMLTVMISIAMVFSALAILSFAAQPAFAASGTITSDPVVFAESGGALVSTITVFNGGSFGSGASVTFYLSTSTTFGSGKIQLSSSVSTIPAGTTTFSNFVTKLSGGSGLSAGTYYIAATDDSGSTFTSPVSVTIISTAAPTISLSPSSVTPGTTVTVSGSNWDSGSTLALYLNYAGGTALISSFAASSLGSETFSVPTNLPGSAGGTTYNVVAQETSSSSTNYGITADSSFTLSPEVTVTSTPASISGATTSSFTLTGHGFPASQSFTASTSLNPTATITVGGVDALVAAFSSDSTGTLTASVTGLNSAISSYGSATITMKDSTPTTYTSVGSILVSIPNPTGLGFHFAVTPTSPLTGSNVYVNDSVTITVWDFPASQSTQFNLGSTSVGSLTTDVNGAGTLSTVIPAIPAGTYTPTAVVSSDYISIKPSTSPLTITVVNSFKAVDSAFTALTNSEYLPSTGDITVQAYGLTPTTNSYDFADSEVATGGVYSGGLLVASPSVGTETSSGLQPAANGTLIFTYSPGYASLSSPPATGTPITVKSLNSVNEYGYLNTGNYAYKAIGAVTFTAPTSLAIEKAGSSVTLTLGGMIPYNANVYPGVVVTYNVYVGTSEQTLSFTNHANTVVTGTTIDSGDSLISFTAPSTNGLYNLSIAYNGLGTSTAPGTEQIVVSATGSSASAGSLVLVSTTNGYDVVGYGYSANPKFYYASYGNSISSGTNESVTHGAFVDTSTLGSIQYS